MTFLFDDARHRVRRASPTTAAQTSARRSLPRGPYPRATRPDWHRAWKATAERVAKVGRKSLAHNDRVIAHEAPLRASNYYRTAEFFQRHDAARDPEAALLSARSPDTYVTAMPLFGSGFEHVSIPHHDTTLPGSHHPVDDSGRVRPTTINGFDSTQEGSNFAIAG
jgi:hypothetical protein